MFTIFDSILITVIIVSALHGLLRGLISQLLYIISWIASFLIASKLTGIIIYYFPNSWMGGKIIQWISIFIIIVIFVIYIISMINTLLNNIIESNKVFNDFNKLLGLIFGITRGCILILLLAFFMNLTKLSKKEFFHNSLLLPYANQGLYKLKPFISKNLYLFSIANINYIFY